MKSIALCCSVLAVALFLWRCSDDGGGSQNASTSTFESPSGAITDANATQVVNDSLDVASGDAGLAVEGLPLASGKLNIRRIPKFGKSRQAFTESCVTFTSSSEAIWDLKCASDAGDFDPCTASGTIPFSGDGTKYESNYNDVSFTCPTDSGGQDTFTCNGSINGDTSTSIQCENGSCSNSSGDVETWNYCNYFGTTSDDISVDGDGGNVVCLALYPNADCTTVCGDFEDETGSVKIGCPVSSKDDSVCPSDATGIDEVSDCVQTVGETCQ